MCHGHKNGKPLDSGTSREHRGKGKSKKSREQRGTRKTEERRYLRRVAKEISKDPRRTDGVRGKKFRKKRKIAHKCRLGGFGLCVS